MFLRAGILLLLIHATGFMSLAIKNQTFVNAKKRSGMVVGFSTEEDVTLTIEKLNGYSLNKRSLKVADVLQHSSEKKNVTTRDKENDLTGQAQDLDSVADKPVSKPRSARDAVTPLAHMSYDDQLIYKKGTILQLLKKLSKNARKARPHGSPLLDWVASAKSRVMQVCHTMRMRIDVAERVFCGMLEKDVVSWNVMMLGHGMHGHGQEDMNLFEEMQKVGLQPDHVTFVVILSSYSHLGLVDEGWKYFNSMEKDHNIMPRIEHYACMVDLLGRAGLVKEAYDFIEKMPIEPDFGVWGALVGACRIHGIWSWLRLLLIGFSRLIRTMQDTGWFCPILLLLLAGGKMLPDSKH